jgi:acyl carrier protein
MASKGAFMSDSLSDTVRCAVAQHLDVESNEVRPTHRFERDLGLRQLDLLHIVLRLEEVESVELPIDELDAVQKVSDLTTLLRSTIANDNHGAPARRRVRGCRPVLRPFRRAG